MCIRDRSSDADLDAILSELGVGTGKKRAPVEPILLLSLIHICHMSGSGGHIEVNDSIQLTDDEGSVVEFPSPFVLSLIHI